MLRERPARRVAPWLGLLLIAAAGCRGRPPAPPDPEPWHAWRRAHLAAAGRVIDGGQGGISHSEGQAYGMLLATAWHDEATFDRIWDWTRAHLAVRDDGLLAWRWEPGPDGGRITDRNNATDGDLLAAWALVRAARRFGRPELLDAARALARAVRRTVVRASRHGPVLLPGAEGFVHDGQTTVNLSYWIFPALSDLAAVDPDPVWQALDRSGRALVRACRFSEHGLPADWITLADPPRPSRRFAPRFGYDAVRVPLYLAWSGRIDRALFERLDAFWRAAGERPPAWVDLVTGETGEPAPDGFLAVRGLVARSLASPRVDSAAEIPVPAGGGYYSDTLALLALVAAHEAGGR
ncbi:MAG: hypothetical protein D6738_15060 [Acidobacteria bacterium]|nr:MAG: hypothetical protein D6738_15060 [Acidobacteriota bacterium]